MRIADDVKTKLDELFNVETNPDYPDMTPAAFAGFIHLLAGKLPGMAAGTLVTNGTEHTVTYDADAAEDEVTTYDANLTFDPQVVIIANETAGTIHASLMSGALKSWLFVVDDEGTPSITFVADNTITRGSRSFVIDAAILSDEDVVRYIALGV